MQKKSADNKFTRKDYITLGFSFLALVISSVGFYYNNLKVEDNLQLRILGLANFGQEGSIDSANLQVLILNAGNRPGIVLGIELQFSQQENGNEEWGITNRHLFPVILQPHEIKLITLKIPYKIEIGQPLMNLSITRGDKKYEGGPYTRGSKYFLNLGIQSMDSKANLFNKLSPKIIYCEMDSSGNIQSFTSQTKFIGDMPQLSLYSQ